MQPCRVFPRLGLITPRVERSRFFGLTFASARVFFFSSLFVRVSSLPSVKPHQQKPSLPQSTRLSLGGGIVWLCVCALAVGSAAFAESEEVELEGPQTYREMIALLDPMETSGLDSQLASVLRDYYEYNFSDRATWGGVESIRFEGELITSHGTLRFVAFKKKPDYCKVVVFRGVQPLLVMGYDGEDAWQIDMAISGEARAMSTGEALNFIRDATTGGHLFYPQFPGKTIELKGSTLTGGRRCFELLVALPNGQRVTYMLGMLGFREHQQITENALTGKREVITHTHFREHQGVRLPARSELTIDEELVHTVVVHNVQFNLGVMPWMFARASGALLAGAEDAGHFSSFGVDLERLQMEPIPVEASDPLIDGSFSPFAPPSAFNLSDAEVQLLVDDIEAGP